MDVATLEQWLWDAACEIRGPLDAPKFKDYILPLVFLKRLSDVFDDEVAALAEEYGSAGEPPEDMFEELLVKVRMGLLESPFTAHAIKDYCTDRF